MENETNQRQDLAKNFVAAAPSPLVPSDQQGARHIVQHLTAPPLVVTNGSIDGEVLQGVRAVSETSTPQERARATGERLLYLYGGILILAAIVGYAEASFATFAVIAAVGMVAAFVWTTHKDSQDSPLATERHKANQYKNIRIA